MCECDDHLAWKHPVSFEACKGLRTIGGYDQMGIKLSIFGLYFYAPDSYRITFIPHLIQASVFVGRFIVIDLDSPLWIRVGGRLTSIDRSDREDMDSR
ncbi:hypothetical protein AAG906_022726 [Vitis piasezkii]